MGGLYSLALHDLKVSEGRQLISIIEKTRQRFCIPLTIHLVFDAELETQPELLLYLHDQGHAGNLEIVFHGLKHTCSKNVPKLWAFFHKYQAEYLDNDEEHRQATKKRFAAITDQLKLQIGICPPCWLASRENLDFFRSLHPLYIETMLHVQHRADRVISPVISLGSPRRIEVFFLKILARIIFSLSFLLFVKRVRIALHVCDLKTKDSLLFFEERVSNLNRRGFTPVLLRELL
jgi:hypothetical protein